MGELRNSKHIAEQAKESRIDPKASIDNWSIEELSDDLESLALSIQNDIQKLRQWDFNNKESAKRIRSYISAVGTIGTRFIVLSSVNK